MQISKWLDKNDKNPECDIQLVTDFDKPFFV